MTAEQKEKKNKKRGMYITLFFHMVIVVAAIFPFTQIIEFDEPKDIALLEDQKTYVEINTQFVQTVGNSQRSSTSSSSSSNANKVEDPKPMPSPTPTPDPKPVVTTELPNETPPIPTPPVPNNNENLNNHATPAPPTPNPTPIGSPNPSNGNGTGNNPSPNHGNGEDDDSKLGDGVFGRKVIFRPDIKNMTRQKGKIVVKICVNQEGKVVLAQYLPQFSTIEDPNLANAAEYYAKRYKFDRDYTSPAKQCGKLTFVFELND